MKLTQVASGITTQPPHTDTKSLEVETQESLHAEYNSNWNIELNP